MLNKITIWLNLGRIVHSFKVPQNGCQWSMKMIKRQKWNCRPLCRGAVVRALASGVGDPGSIPILRWLWRCEVFLLPSSCQPSSKWVPATSCWRRCKWRWKELATMFHHAVSLRTVHLHDKHRHNFPIKKLGGDNILHCS